MVPIALLLVHSYEELKVANCTPIPLCFVLSARTKTPLGPQHCHAKYFQDGTLGKALMIAGSVYLVSGGKKQA